MVRDMKQTPFIFKEALNKSNAYHRKKRSLQVVELDNKVPSLNSQGFPHNRNGEKILVVNSETNSSYPQALSSDREIMSRGIGMRPIKLGGYTATVLEENT
jgi:hypothetical protein